MAKLGIDPACLDLAEHFLAEKISPEAGLP